jgi:hypothetical protein
MSLLSLKEKKANDIKYIGAIFMLAGALFGGLSHSKAELMGARVLLGIGTAFARLFISSLYRFILTSSQRSQHVPSFPNWRIPGFATWQGVSSTRRTL